MQNPTLNRIVEWRPYHTDQFAVGNSGKLELIEINKNRQESKDSKDIYTHPHAVQPVFCSSLNWHPDFDTQAKAVIAYGTSIGQVAALSWTTREEVRLNIQKRNL